MVHAMSAREQILDALEQVLIDDGVPAATLETVAARAGVSKGGLLYHFSSKQALVEGLAERLRAHGEADLAQMAAAPDGPSAFYVRSSVFEDTAFDRTLIAASRVAGNDGVPAVREAFDSLRADWRRLIREEVGDEDVAEAIMLIGDGLYYNAALDTPDHQDAAHREAGMSGLIEVVEQLRSLGASRSASPR